MPPESSQELLDLLRAELALAERRERNSRHKDDFRLPPRAYEIIEDIAKVDAALAVLRVFWHKDRDDYRKASMHLSKMAWDLRKELREWL